MAARWVKTFKELQQVQNDLKWYTLGTLRFTSHENFASLFDCFQTHFRAELCDTNALILLPTSVCYFYERRTTIKRKCWIGFAIFFRKQSQRTTTRVFLLRLTSEIFPQAGFHTWLLFLGFSADHFSMLLLTKSFNRSFLLSFSSLTILHWSQPRIVGYSICSRTCSG